MVEWSIKADLAFISPPTGRAVVGGFPAWACSAPGISMWAMFADVKQSLIQNLLQLMRCFLMSLLCCRAHASRWAGGWGYTQGL